MSREAVFQFLGTGPSMGIPVVGCHCNVCLSSDPHNQRLRPSALVQVNGKNLLIDAGPDVREQALRVGMDRVDGVLLTHTHYDHIGGMDDLRIYFFIQEAPIPCLVSKQSLKELKSRYDYLFRPRVHGNSLPVQLEFEVLNDNSGEVEFIGEKIAYTTFRHGGMLVNGFRFGKLAYICDICDYPETIFEDLVGVEILCVSALRHEKSAVHFTVADAVEFSRKVGAKQTWITHIAHELDHHATNQDLPSDIRLAYDGLRFSFEY